MDSPRAIEDYLGLFKINLTLNQLIRLSIIIDKQLSKHADNKPVNRIAGLQDHRIMHQTFCA